VTFAGPCANITDVMEGQAPVNVGDVLADKYRIERILGVGGMGVVVAATHLQLEQLVALKFMLPHALVNQEAVQRFMREARNAVKLRSEHVARIIDVGTLPNSAPYIVMEFLQGTDLQSVLEKQGVVPVQTVVDYILQASEAIAEAHAHGIVHRDLKPANLFLTRRPDGQPLVKVLDFGISKAGGTSDFQLTQTAAVMGSPAYMSPEQMRSSKLVDSRSDIWALGVILYQAATGQVPFAAETFTELCLRVAMDPAPAMRAPYAIPPGFEAMVQRCLEKDPAHRPQTIAELAQILQPFASQPQGAQLAERIVRVLHGDAGPPSVSGSHNVQRSPSTLGNLSGQLVSGKRRSKWPLIGALIVAGGAVAGVVAALSMTPAPPVETKPAAAPEPAVAPPPPPPQVPEIPKVVITVPDAGPTPVETPPVVETPVAEKPRGHRERGERKPKPPKPPVETPVVKPADPPARPKPTYDPLNSPD
jgi:serine/threonine protein kinase